MRLTSRIAAVLGVVVFAAAAFGQAKAFPDDWFFSGAQRPAELKRLEGKPATELTIDTWIGESVSLKEQRGKVVVVDFWATWCGPCMAAIPHNVELVKKYKEQGMVFVGVHDANAGWDSADKVVKDKGINYPVGLDKKSGRSGKSTQDYSLQFWPTYVVIDRSGVVRGAGLTPDSVERAVKLLLAEAAPSGSGVNQAGGLPEEWFFAGAARPAGMRRLEGKPAPALAAEKWSEGEAIQDPWKGRVAVLHFFSALSSTSMKQLDELAALERDLAPQGVVFIGVCDRRGEWDHIVAAAKAKGTGIPLVRDGESPEGEAAGRGAGATAVAYSVRFVPATVIIDRTGTVRATGVRTDQVKAIAGKLLAERVAGEATP